MSIRDIHKASVETWNQVEKAPGLIRMVSVSMVQRENFQMWEGIFAIVTEMELEILKKDALIQSQKDALQRAGEKAKDYTEPFSM